MKENEKDTVETTKVEPPKAEPAKVEPTKEEVPKAVQTSCMDREIAALIPYSTHISTDNVYVVMHIGHPNSPTAQAVHLPHVAREIKMHFTPTQD